MNNLQAALVFGDFCDEKGELSEAEIQEGFDKIIGSNEGRFKNCNSVEDVISELTKIGLWQKEGLKL